MIPSNIYPPPIARQSLRSGPKSAAAGTETVIKSIRLLDGTVPYLVSRALYAESAAGNNISWRTRVGGVDATFPEAQRDTAEGAIGAPNRIAPVVLPPGVLFELVAVNADGSNDYSVETDGDIYHYDKPL